MTNLLPSNLFTGRNFGANSSATRDAYEGFEIPPIEKEPSSFDFRIGQSMILTVIYHQKALERDHMLTFVISQTRSCNQSFSVLTFIHLDSDHCSTIVAPAMGWLLLYSIGKYFLHFIDELFCPFKLLCTVIFQL